MLCLGIETSCDETAVALVRDGRLVLEKLATQADLHAVFGGVVPELASREHLRLIEPLLAALFAQACVDPIDIEGIAVARGPGLLGSLLVGLGAAKGLALATGAPLVGVNHLHAHLTAPLLERDVLFPAVGLLVSGGHTQLWRMESPLSFTLLGRTLDDAAGEAFDKVAKLLNLPYPGGRHVDELGRGVTPDSRMFPRPYLDNRNLDFSFSGLKTAAAVHLAQRPHLRLPSLASGPEVLDAASRAELALLLASFAHAVADTLRVKAQRALREVPGARSLIVAGGVAANSRVRERMAELADQERLHLVLPSPGLCTDNAAMIAAHGERLLKAGFAHDLGLDAVPRGRAVPEDWACSPAA